MENKNFINQSLWAGSSPNQTGETQSRENRIGVFSYFYRTFVLLFMLLTIGVGQMWADDPMATGQVFYFKPSSLWITDARFAVCFQWVNGQQNDSWYSLISAGETDVYYAVAPGEYYDMYFCRMKGSDAENKWDNKWNQSTKLQWQEANKYNYFQQVTVDDSGWKESTTWTRYAPKMQSASIANNGTDILAGDGSEGHPYLVATGATIKVSASATSCVEADGDQTKRYTFQKADNSGEFVSMQDGTSTTYQIDASSTANTIHKFKVSAYNRYSKYTESNIDGTAAASTIIYYKTVPVKDITVYIYVGGCTDAQINSLVLTAEPYVDSKQLPAVNIHAAGFTIEGDWRKYTFTNVSEVRNVFVACQDGRAVNNITITDDIYYKYDGTKLDGKCVPPANPTWGTAPANGKAGGSMTASVSGAPAGATITWSSTNENTASVNSSGFISYKAPGPATIKARIQKEAGGDYCELDHTLSQDITVTSGATVTATRACPKYVSNNSGQVKLDISSTGASTGWYYRVCNSAKTAYYAPDEQSAANNTLSWTMNGALPTGSNTLVVELYNSDRQLVCTSTPVTVNVEIAESVTISAGANGYVSPSGTVYANSNNLHPTITATPYEHYHFDKWTSNNLEKASVADDKSAITTVTAGASGYTITANFAGDQYRIAYKDQGNVNYTGNNEGSLPATHTYGTATVLENGTKDGYAFKGWYMTPECTGEAVTSLVATAYTNDITLYAKWGKNPSLTGLDLSKSVVTTGNTFTATPTIDAGDGRTTNVCWAVKNSSDEEFSTTITPTGGNAVTITAPAAPGNYKVVATLREGNSCGGTVLNSLQQFFTVEGSYTVTIPNGTGSSFVGEETTATVTADPAEAGMKFDHWEVTTGTITKYTSGDVNSRVITFNASSDITLTAFYTDRDSKTVYFARPSGWTDGLKVYAWEEATKDGGNPSNKNANWPGVECTSTKTEKGTTYYSYTYYIDDNGEGDDKTAQERWDKIIFNDNGNDSEKTKDLTLVNGHFYHIADGSGENERNTATVSGSTSAEDWYVCGYWDQSTHDWGFAHPVDLNGSPSGSVVVTVTASCTQEFKIYRASTNEWFKWTGGPSENYDANYPALIGDPMTLRIYDLNRNTFTSYATEYRFTLDITNPSNPVLTLTPNDNTPYSATLSKNGNGSLSVGTGAITLHQYIPTTITATPEPGYRFKQWTVSGVGCSSTTSATATFTATDAGGTITAEFTNEGIIYLDKSAISSKWSGTPYVYFYSGEYWNNVSGSGSKTSSSEGVPGTCISASKAMTRIGESQIWYYDYSALLSAGTSKQYIAFVDKSDQTGKNWFDACSVIYRGDFYPGASMFVVRDYTVYKNKHNNVQTAYYNEGYWRKYNDTDPGYVLKIYNGTGGGSTKIGYAKFASEEPGNNTCTAKINLSSGLKGFKVEGCDTTTINGVSYAGTWYSNSGSMTSTNCSNWEFTTGVSANCGITPTAGGDYIFTLSLADGRLYVSVEYPLANNDYRIVYNGKVKTTGSATHHPSNFIRNTSNGGVGKDTVSFFVTGDWSLTLQKCTNASANPVQWANACDAGHTLTASDLGLSGKTGVYVFEIEQNSSGSCSGVTIRNLGEYTGNYYIRTDVADGGWEAYETVPDNKMIFSEYARDHSGFDYYHCHWTPTNTNVKFTIANDYSACITDTVENDTYVTEYGKLPYQANIRFMYNSATNSIGRAYLNGSSEEGVNTFLWLEGAAANGSEPKIFTESGSALTNNIIKMQDKNNWIYQIDIQANEQARVKLISNYRFNGTDHLQYFKGTDGDWSKETTSEIIGGDYSSHRNERHALRIIYDFKTNHLLSAWLVPGSGSVPAAPINTNVMIIKQNQEDARQITFSSGNALTEVDTVYTAVLLTKEFLTDGGASEYAKQFYWVSFPYTVKINDIFGSVGTYGYDWILQRYNGKKRAANGFWIDSEPNWEFMDKSETLNPYEGYILTLDLSEFTTASNKWGNSVTTLSLYFPSDSKVGNIKQKDVTVAYDQTGYVCTITRDNRNIKDSYWHCIGSPSFAENTIGGWNRHENTDDTWKTENLPFLYEWNSATNQLSPVAAGGDYIFKPLTGYMVQYSGASLNWTNVVTPSVSAPKRQNSAATDLTYKLQLVRGEEEVDHTFVRFSDDENITAAFEFNQDLCKEYKSGGNIYTITSDAIQVAGNSLPLSTTQTTIVPVGVKIKTAGDYTFSIPEGTDGIGVTLVDNEAGVRTLLSALDYTVNLTAGTHDGRFILEISPIQNTPTGIENVQGDNVQCTKVRKVMIDGILYIVKDGKIFDARGARVE